MLNNKKIDTNAYQGTAISKHLIKGKGAGRISIHANVLIFHNKDASVEFPLVGLNITSGGASNRLIFFKHDSLPDWTLYTSDKQILKNEILSQRFYLKGQISLIHKQKYIKCTFYTFGLILLICLLWGVLLLKEPICISIAKQIPPIMEEKLGHTALLELQLSKNIIENEKLNHYMTSITERLFEHIPDKRFEYKIFVVSDPAINAFALPGGYIVCNTGLITILDSIEELLGVIAHETAHCNLQHGLRNIISSVGFYVIISTLFSDINSLISILIDKSQMLLEMKYSKDYERQADNTGWQYMEQANINPKGMIDCFEKMMELEKNNLVKMPDSMNFLSTHPLMKERIDYLQKKLPMKDQHVDYIDFNITMKEIQKFIRTDLEK